MKINVLVLSGFGLNCENETIHSFELVGAKASKIHINSLIEGETNLQDYQILVFGGGFSWGDDHGAGVLQAVRLKSNINDKIQKFIEDKKLIIGICNGFQTIVNMGLVPSFDKKYKKRQVALINNDCGNFRNDWVHLKVNKKSNCVFTKDIDFIELPIRHGEGKFYADNATIKKLIKNNQIVLQYSLKNKKNANGKFPENPNGSLCDIAGICNTTGRIFGLMPHPEAFHSFENHPHWTKKKVLKGDKAKFKFTGLKIFKNAVEYFR